MIRNRVKPGHAFTFMKSLASEINFIVYNISLTDLIESSRAGNK